ncbi:MULTISPECIES: FeoA family protein [Enterococcus]|uniref:Ferrous iron transporter A n=1 Tax=Enterococcus thailandicus TaxID=417368 RepID=A0A179ETJ2_ENTTH|nr:MULTISPECIES: ferrous iron transport protein A [Enterococcus]ASZ08370.1 ferrous iron transport protein A [Enterococcus thailandicus]MDA3965067.1 ferrous iron transport protein A [Enterococcus thailandicus]MDK4352052.1 ferrous iron transport protein A [Enterococcus thailandicus]MDT2734468.1 ferrous iron transport protein A [Enterococcus thailandicus]MDT2752672.1 ferrous iron transport protein A [Enterococcus thailandicus]
METLAQAKQNLVYQIVKIQTKESVKNHLQNLGIIPGTKIVVVNLSGENAILLLKNNRIAVNRELLAQIFVKKPDSIAESWTSLDQLTVGESATVVALHGQGAVKRRLMDMGVTKNVRVAIRKLAPLGDPIEITLRGYELTLRKKEAELILVQKERSE